MSPTGIDAALGDESDPIKIMRQQVLEQPLLALQTHPLASRFPIPTPTPSPPTGLISPVKLLRCVSIDQWHFDVRLPAAKLWLDCPYVPAWGGGGFQVGGLGGCCGRLKLDYECWASIIWWWWWWWWSGIWGRGFYSGECFSSGKGWDGVDGLSENVWFIWSVIRVWGGWKIRDYWNGG